MSRAGAPAPAAGTTNLRGGEYTPGSARLRVWSIVSLCCCSCATSMSHTSPFAFSASPAPDRSAVSSTARARSRTSSMNSIASARRR